MACDLGFRPSDNPEYYFLSYNSEDADRVSEIVIQMSQFGINLWYDKGVEYGEKWEKIIAEKIHDCQAVVLFFTKGILSKENSYVEKEYKIALKFQRKIYVVMMDDIEDGDVPPEKMPWWIDIKDLQCVEAHVIAEPYRVAEEILVPLKALDVTESANALGHYKIPNASKQYLVKCLTTYVPVGPETGLIGRDDILERVRDMLEGNKSIVLVSGLGGIGKTAVMSQICNNIMAESRKDTYVAWITCTKDYIDDLLTLRQTLGVSWDISREEAYEEVVRKLQKLQGTLYLFLDDMERTPNRRELGTYNALCTNVRIMITSRHRMKGIPHVDIHELEEQSVVNMFYEYYGRDEERRYEKEARAIIYSGSVRGHTLLVELIAKAAGAFFGNLAEFRRELEEKGFLRVSQRRFDTGRFDNKTIAESVTNLYDILDLTTDQQRIMSLFSIFTPEKVIYGAVERWADFDVDAVDGLVKLGWLSRTENGFVIHQIVRDSLAGQVGENLKIEEYGELFDQVIETQNYMPRDLEYTAVRERLILTEDIARYLLNKTKGWLESGNLSAEERVFLINASALYDNTAYVYENQGDYKRALEYYDKALAIRKCILGSEHSYTASTYNNMAMVFRKQGDYDKALLCYDKALMILEQVSGLDNSNTALTYNNMGVVFNEQGDYGKALEYSSKALVIQERILGLEHSDTASTYNNIAMAHLRLGNCGKALEYFDKAITIREKVLGYKHPSTATTYNNMAEVFLIQKNYGKAFEYYNKALSIDEQVLGPDHPETAKVYNNIAAIYYIQGDYEKTLSFYRKALAIQERVLGTEHLDGALTHYNMARMYISQGDYGKARIFLDKVIPVFMKKLGKSHPYTKSALEWMRYVK